MQGDAGRAVENASRPTVGHHASENAGKDPPIRERVFLYRVKKGDTLHGIARRYGTSVAILLELNRMNLSDPLYVDRMLKIPARTAVVADEKRQVASAKRPPVRRQGRSSTG